MYLMWSQMEEAWRDTLVHKAVGYAFSRVSNFYGFPFPEDEVSERAWRGALHVEALGRRGTFWATFNALEAAFSDFNEKFTVEIDSASPYVIRRLDGNDWETIHNNRYIRTPFGLLFTVGTPSGSPEDEMLVSTVGTRYWDAPSYDVDTYDETDVPVEVLPFMLYERGPGPITVTSDNLFEGDPCLLEVSLYPGAVLLEIPPTFLQEEVLTYEVSAAPSGDAVFTLATSPYIVAGTPVQLSRPGAGFLPAPFTEDDTYFVVNPTPNTVELEATVGGGAITKTAAGLDLLNLVIATDPDMPLGGNLLEDENWEGNNDNGGPYPVYLYDGDLFPSLQAAIQATLPSGVHVRVAMHPMI